MTRPWTGPSNSSRGAYGYSGVYVIVGPPGTGKTYRISRTVERVVEHPEARALLAHGGCPIAVCSLTKTAAREAASRISVLPRGSVGTLHSFGYNAIPEAKIVTREDIADDWNRRFVRYAISPDAYPSSKSRSGVVEGSRLSREGPSGGRGDDYHEDYHLRRHRMQDRSEWPSEVLKFAKLWDRWKGELEKIDFTDMIAQAPGHRLRPRIFVVDEAQDLSRLEMEYVNRIQRDSDAALILVGDPYQGLYAWRGADPEQLLRIRDEIGDAHFDVLGRSRRVPATVAKVATSFLSRHLSYFDPTVEYQPRFCDPGDPESGEFEGTTRTIGSSFMDPSGAVDLAIRLESEKKSVLILTSCNYMTRPICTELRHRRVPFWNRWRPTETGWNPLGGRSMTRRRIIAALRLEIEHDPEYGEDLVISCPTWTYAELWSWIECCKVSCEGFLNRGTKVELKRMASDKDVRHCVVEESHMGRWFGGAFWDYVELMEQDQGAALDMLRRRYLSADWRGKLEYGIELVRARGVGVLVDEPLISISTIHACKGGEADVVILFPDISRASYDEWADWGRTDATAQQFYVGMTRARDALYIGEASLQRGRVYSVEDDILYAMRE